MTDLPGFSVFFKDADNQIFHTYSTYGRGLDPRKPPTSCLISSPRGAMSPLFQPMSWVRLTISTRSDAMKYTASSELIDGCRAR